MGDNRSRHQSHKAVDRKQRGGQILGLRWVDLEADFDHVTQNGNYEAIEEGFCFSWVTMGGTTDKGFDRDVLTVPENKPSVAVKIIKALDERH